MQVALLPSGTGWKPGPHCPPRRALTNAAAIAAIVITMNSPHPSSEEIFHRLLDESSALLAAPESRGIAIPDDELHREIIIPLLPAMLADAAIRGHWSEQAATGFVARIGRHFENGEAAPRWTPGDFEIHVTASFSAGADARALADTLLSEDSLRDMTATLMNQLLDALWPSLAPAPSVVPAEPATEFPAPAAEEIPEPIIPAEPEPAPELAVEIAEEIFPPQDEPETVVKIQPAWEQPSRALVRTLCRKLAASIVRRGMVATSSCNSSAAIIARQIRQRARPRRKKS